MSSALARRAPVNAIRGPFNDSSTIWQEMWKQAKDDYLAVVSTNSHERQIDIPHVRSLDDLIRELDRRNSKFADFRSKGRKGLDVLRTTLQPVQIAGNILAGGGSNIFPPTTQVLGAITFPDKCT